VSGTSNPQVASYTVTSSQAASVTIEYGRDMNYALKTWAVATPAAGGTVTILVAGMLANSAYHMRADLVYTDGTTATDVDHVFTTGNIPAKITAQFSATTTSGLTPQPGIELINGSSDNLSTLVATDLEGHIIWTYPFNDQVVGSGASPVNQVVGMQQLDNGDLLAVCAPGSSVSLKGPVDPTLPDAVREINLAGDTVKQLTIAALNSALVEAGFNLVLQNFSHEVVVLPNGHWLVLAGTLRSVTLTGQSSPTTVLGDVIVDVDENMKPVWVWNTFDHLDVNRHPYMFPDWTHANAIVYSQDDGNLLFSMRHQNWIIKIDYENGSGSGNVLWHLGPGTDSDFKLENSDGSPDTNPADWFYAQHYPHFFSSNTTGVFSLGIMDNGDDRAFSNGTNCDVQAGSDCYTTIPVLQIDENAKTAEFLFHQVLPAPLYSFFGGNVRPLDNGNIEYDLAGVTTGAAIYEVTNQSSPQTIWSMTAPQAYMYRAYRVPSLYPGVQWTGTDF
jgi:hypothetical protein